MAAITLNILKPSVNNLTVRIFVRAAELDFEEQDVWGTTTSPEYLEKYPAHLTPMIEEEGLPRGTLGESCAIMAYLCNKHGLEQFYPTDPGKRAMVDNAMFYLIGTFYPLLTRATYPALGFPQYPGEVATSAADDRLKATAQQDAEAALAEPLDVFRSFFLDGKPFIGGDSPSIADIRLSATLEFLNAIDYDLPAWAREYMAAMESSLGEAYTEPAADVRGYIASVKPVAVERSASSRSSARPQWISGVAEARHLIGVEVAQHLLLDLVHGAVAPLERPASRLGQLGADDAAVVRVRAALNVAAVDQLRERLAHRLGRDERAAGELRVGEAVLCPQHRQRHVGGQRESSRLDGGRQSSAKHAVEAADQIAEPRFHPQEPVGRSPARLARPWWSRPRNVFAQALVRASALSLTITGPSSIDSSSPYALSLS